MLEKESMWGDRVLPFIVDTMLFDLDYPDDIAPVEQALRRLEQGDALPRAQSGRHPV